MSKMLLYSSVVYQWSVWNKHVATADWQERRQMELRVSCMRCSIINSEKIAVHTSQKTKKKPKHISGYTEMAAISNLLQHSQKTESSSYSQYYKLAHIK